MRTRTTRTLIALLAGALLLTGCTWGRRPMVNDAGDKVPPRAQPNPAAMSVDIQSMRNENEALRARQHDNEKQIATLNDTLDKMRREQRAFREAMATNFDLLEQSVALTLSKTVTADLAPAPAAAPAPAKPMMRTAAQQPPAQQPATHKPMTQVRPAPAKADTGAASGGMNADHAAAKPSRPTGPAIKATPVAAVVPQAPARERMDSMDSMDDPDLQPPANPRKLVAHRPAKSLYEKGFALFAQRQYEQSIIVFQNFLNRYPNDVYSDNAQFWIGEALLRMKRLDEAETAYRGVLREFEHHSTLEGYKTPDAIYRIGQTYAMRNEPRRARTYFQAAAERFPESSAGRKAKRDLASLGLKTASN